MNELAEISRSFCISLPTLPDSEANVVLRGVKGRGDYGVFLLRWLEQSRDVFPEAVRVEYPEDPTDRGIDVYVEGLDSQTLVGFQIKSESDVTQADFLQRLKAQILEAIASYPGLRLYVIVMACQTGGRERTMRLQRAFNEMNRLRSITTEVLFLMPGRAASLYRLCQGKPLTAADRSHLLNERTWSRFFHASGVPTRENEFLQSWPLLTPNERFIVPREWSDIKQSLCDNVLTVLVGPPTVGKTFTAVQLLWERYKEGRPIAWIEPMGMGLPDSLVPAREATPGFRERTRYLAEQLGVEPQRPPLDTHDFVAAQLRPSTLVLLEDPFGVTDEDYDFGLHRSPFDFFDLKACVEAVSKHARRQSCRLLLTSRHGLFDRWLAEQRACGAERGCELVPPMRVIHLSPDSYDSQSRNEDEHPKVVLASKLLTISDRASGKTLAELARLIGRRADTPREVEMIINKLSLPTTHEEVSQILSQVRGGAVERTRAYCRAETDAERLFLFLLLLTLPDYRTTWFGQQHNDFARVYAEFHKALNLPGDAAEADQAARVKYWPLFYTIDYGERPRIFNYGIHLKASHPSVGEAARDELLKDDARFLNLLSEAAVRVQSQQISANDEPAYSLDQRMLVRFLLHYRKYLSADGIAHLATVLPIQLKPISLVSFDEPLGIILQNWTELSQLLRDAFFEALRSGDQMLPSNVCERIKHSMFSQEEVWRIYSIYIERDGPQWHLRIPKFGEHPWEYWLEHRIKAPQEWGEMFNRMAIDDPLRLTYVLGRLAGKHWDKMPPDWQTVILMDHSQHNKRNNKYDKNVDWKIWILAALEQVFDGLFERDDTPDPEPLLAMLESHLTHPDPEFRLRAGTQILVHWEKASARLKEMLNDLFVTESDPYVIKQILQQGMGPDVHDEILARVAVERANVPFMAALLGIFLGKMSRSLNSNESPSWIRKLATECLTKGGDFARAVLVAAEKNAETARELGWTQLTSVENEPSIVKLAYIWKECSSPDGVGSWHGWNKLSDKAKERKTHKTQIITRLIPKLNVEHRAYAYASLALERNRLPPSLQLLVDRAARSDDVEVRDAVQQGLETANVDHHQSHYEFPILQLGAALKPLSIQSNDN